MPRLKDAFRWNEPQVTACLVATCMNLAAACANKNFPQWPLIIFAALVWPTIICIHNFFDPLPEDTK